MQLGKSGEHIYCFQWLGNDDNRFHNKMIDLVAAITGDHEKVDEIKADVASVSMAHKHSIAPELNVSTYLSHEKQQEEVKERFRAAIRKGAVPEVQALIGQLSDLNITDRNGQSYLHLAVDCNYPEVVDALLSGGADRRAMNNQGYTPVVCAARSGYDQVLKKFLEHDPELLNEADLFSQMTLLHHAAERGHQKTVSLLLMHHADFELTTHKKTKLTPLHLAAKNGHAEVVKLLLKAGANVDCRDRYNKSPLFYAAECKEHASALNIISCLFENKPQLALTINDQEAELKCTALHNAADQGNLPVVQLLMAKGGRPDLHNANGNTPLYDAVAGGHTEVALFILNDSPATSLYDGNRNWCLPKYKDNRQKILELAAEGGHFEMFKVFFEQIRPDIDSEFVKNTLLNIAMKRLGNQAIVSYLLNKGISTGFRCSDGTLAIHKAAENGELDIVKLLYNDRVMTDQDRALLLYNAVRSNNCRLVYYLLAEKRINPNMKVGGETALHGAVVNKLEKVAVLLLWHQADPKIKDKRNRTVLEAAINDRREEVLSARKHANTLISLQRSTPQFIHTLLQHGAEPGQEPEEKAKEFRAHFGYEMKDVKDISSGQVPLLESLCKRRIFQILHFEIPYIAKSENQLPLPKRLTSELRDMQRC